MLRAWGFFWVGRHRASMLLPSQMPLRGDPALTGCPPLSPWLPVNRPLEAGSCSQSYGAAAWPPAPARCATRRSLALCVAAVLAALLVLLPDGLRAAAYAFLHPAAARPRPAPALPHLRPLPNGGPASGAARARMGLGPLGVKRTHYWGEDGSDWGYKDTKALQPDDLRKTKLVKRKPSVAFLPGQGRASAVEEEEEEEMPWQDTRHKFGRTGLYRLFERMRYSHLCPASEGNMEGGPHRRPSQPLLSSSRGVPIVS